MNIINVKYNLYLNLLFIIIITSPNIYKCLASVNTNNYNLNPKFINDNNITSLKPSLKYLHNVNKSIIDWTTSLPILGPINSARISGAKSCLDDNMHTYYNSELDFQIMELIKQYFKNKSISCPISNIKIRYTSFDIIRDFYSSIQIDKNDKILIIAPTYGYYILQTAEYNLNTVLVHAKKENNWKITPKELDAALKEVNPKILLFTNPVNPTGVFYNKKEIEDLALVIKKYKVFSISDEIFSEINFSGTNKPYSLAAAPGMNNRTITLSGIGKSRGIRLSFACSPINFISTLPTSGILMPIQVAAKEVLKDSEENKVYLKESIDQYKENIEFILNKINHINKIMNSYYKTSDFVYVKPYIIPNSTNIFLLSFLGIKGKKIRNTKINSGLELAEYLAAYAGVATVPGEAFFIDKNEIVVRIPISVSKDELNLGLNKILDSLIYK